MKENKKTVSGYNEHVSDIHKLVLDTYGAEYHAMAYTITVNLISPNLLMRHLLTGDPVPDPEYIMFSLAKDLSECKVTLNTFETYTSGLHKPEKIHSILDEAMELTENAGFGDIQY